MTTSFYSENELADLGLKSYGRDVKISSHATLYSPEKISIGDNVRIDDFCILSGDITIGSHIHISAYSAIYGSQGVTFEDYTGMSPRSTIYSAMDDFSGEVLIGPIHPKEKTNVRGGRVIVKKFSQIGCNSVVFPNLTIEEGCIVGAMSLLKKSTQAWTVYAGIPAKAVKKRSDAVSTMV